MIIPEIDKDGIQCYFDENRLRHRDDGPAIIYPDNLCNGYQAWYSHGTIHRENGPARTWAHGKWGEWHQKGILHRINGPASIYNGKINYYINNIMYSEIDYWKEIKKMKHSCKICHFHIYSHLHY